MPSLNDGGFTSTCPTLKQTKRRNTMTNLNLLISYHSLILENKSQIIQNPDWYHIPIDGSFVGAAYTGKVNLHLGNLIELWETTTSWKQNLKNQYFYTYRISGSPLSGRCVYSGFFSNGIQMTFRSTQMIDWLKPFFKSEKINKKPSLCSFAKLIRTLKQNQR